MVRGTGGIDDGFLRVGGQFRFNERWGLVAEVQHSNDAQQYFIGPRVSF